MCREPFDDPKVTGRPRRVADLVADLSMLLNQARFYGNEHGNAKKAAEAALQTIEALLRESNGRPIEIGNADGYLFHDQRPLFDTDRAADRLRPVLEDVGAGGIHVGPETAARDLDAFVELALDRDLAHLSLEDANRRLEAAGARGIKLLGSYAVGEGFGDYASLTLGTKAGTSPARGSAGAITMPSRLYDHLFDYMTDTMTCLFSDRLFRLEETKSKVSLLLSQLNEDAKPLMTATARRTSRADPYLFRHSIRVACIALTVARHFTEDKAVLLRLGAAALLHDIGKRYVPLDVLYHQGPLDEGMRLAMQEHPAHGARLLMQLDDSDPLAIAACVGHHWPMNHGHHGGIGYPRVEYSVQLSAATRLIKICDVYEALTARRPYKPPLPPQQAYRIMISMEPHFDRAMLHRFILANGIWPIGYRIRLKGGAVARVDEQTDDLDRPVVCLEGEEEPRDLRDPRHAALGAIVGLDASEEAAESERDGGADAPAAMDAADDD